MAWTLAKIARKVRFLALATDANAATDQQVYEYIDDFVLYEMPYRIQLDILRKNIRFTCNPYVARYKLDADAIVTELIDFDQKYTILDQPMYCAGYAMRFYQDKSLFKSVYDNTINVKQIGQGDGALAQFSATLEKPILPYSVLITSTNINNGKIVAVDRPDNENALQKNDPSTGTWLDGFYEGAPGLAGNINYITGEMTVTFNDIPQNGAKVDAEFQTYIAKRPQALLYYNSQIELRPVPDKAYIIEFQAQVRPSSLDPEDPNSMPELNQWGEYIAYGAALKLLADKSNNERMAIIMPDFERLEDEVRARTERQRDTRRTYTMFAQQAEDQGGPVNGGFYRGPY